MNDKNDMLEALEPFAKIAQHITSQCPDNYSLMQMHDLTAADFRRAAKVFAAVSQQQSITEIQALDLLKAEILKFGSQRKWCKDYLISNQYVSDILTGKVGIGKSVQAALGIKRVIMYEKVEK